MTISDPKLEQNLRQGFKSFNQFMLLLWRLGLGSWLNAWPEVGGRIMVITHTGRKTGLRRRTPVNYVPLAEDLYCTAGFGPGSDWYRNILTNPQVEVWLPNGWWQATAEDVSESPARLAILRQVLVASGFAARSMGIDPLTASEEELQAATADYRLVRIHRTAPCTGPGGPGDLAWIWPLATHLLVLLLLLRRGPRPRRRR